MFLVLLEQSPLEHQLSSLKASLEQLAFRDGLAHDANLHALDDHMGGMLHHGVHRHMDLSCKEEFQHHILGDGHQYTRGAHNHHGTQESLARGKQAL